MKIITAIKNWYRGKSKPPRKTRLMIGGQLGPEFEMKQEGIIRSPLATLLSIIFGFFGREWKWIISTAISVISTLIALTALFVALSAKKGFIEIKSAEPAIYDSQNNKPIK